MKAPSIVAAVMVLPGLAWAAPPRRVSPTRTIAARHSGPDLLGGFSYNHAGAADLKGWNASAAMPFGGRRFGGSLRIAADLSGHYGSFAGAQLRQTTFLAGPRVAWSRRRLSPFAQVLLGAARTRTALDALSSTSTAWGAAFGGGGDWRLTDRWAARAGADVLLLHGHGVWDTNPRLTVGAVYRFSR